MHNIINISLVSRLVGGMTKIKEVYIEVRTHQASDVIQCDQLSSIESRFEAPTAG